MPSNENKLESTSNPQEAQLKQPWKEWMEVKTPVEPGVGPEIVIKKAIADATDNKVGGY